MNHQGKFPGPSTPPTTPPWAPSTVNQYESKIRELERRRDAHAGAARFYKGVASLTASLFGVFFALSIVLGSFWLAEWRHRPSQTELAVAEVELDAAKEQNEVLSDRINELRLENDELENELACLEGESFARIDPGTCIVTMEEEVQNWPPTTTTTTEPPEFQQEAIFIYESENVIAGRLSNQYFGTVDMLDYPGGGKPPCPAADSLYGPYEKPVSDVANFESYISPGWRPVVWALWQDRRVAAVLFDTMGISVRVDMAVLGDPALLDDDIYGVAVLAEELIKSYDPCG